MTGVMISRLIVGAFGVGALISACYWTLTGEMLVGVPPGENELGRSLCLGWLHAGAVIGGFFALVGGEW